MAKKNSKTTDVASSEGKTVNSHRFVYGPAECEGLDRALAEICQGYEELEIDRNVIASYLFINGLRLMSEVDFQEIRAKSFDEKGSLLNLLKKAENDEDLPAEIRKALRSHYGIGETPKKKKSKDDESTKKNVDSSSLPSSP